MLLVCPAQPWKRYQVVAEVVTLSLRSSEQSQSQFFYLKYECTGFVFERQVIYLIYHRFTKVNASDLRRTGVRNSAPLLTCNFYFSFLIIMLWTSLPLLFYTVRGRCTPNCRPLRCVNRQFINSYVMQRSFNIVTFESS